MDPWIHINVSLQLPIYCRCDKAAESARAVGWIRDWRLVDRFSTHRLMHSAGHQRPTNGLPTGKNGVRRRFGKNENWCCDAPYIQTRTRTCKHSRFSLRKRKKIREEQQRVVPSKAGGFLKVYKPRGSNEPGHGSAVTG